MLICEAVEPDGKTCSACEQYKRLDQFNKGQGRYGLSPWCKACASQRSVGRNRRRLYGVTPEQYAAMWSAQGGLCAACSLPLMSGMGNAALDHDHATGKPRAILDRGCNTALGNLKDDPIRIHRLADYVEAHRAA